MTSSHLNDGGLDGPTLPTEPQDATFIDNTRQFRYVKLSSADLPPHIGASASGAALGRTEVDDLDSKLSGVIPDGGLTTEHVRHGLPSVYPKYTKNINCVTPFMNGFAAEWARFGRMLLNRSFRTLPPVEVIETNGKPLGLWLLVEATVGKFLPSDLSQRVFYGEEVHPYPSFRVVMGREPSKWESSAPTETMKWLFRSAIDGVGNGAKLITRKEQEDRHERAGKHWVFPGHEVVKEVYDTAVKWESEREALVSQYLRGISVWEGLRDFCQHRGLLKKA